MNPLLKLLALNKDKSASFRAEQNGNEATIYIYDVITSDDFWGGVTADNFVKELNALDADVVHLRINSPGGEVFAARAMAQAIKEFKGKVIAHIDGYAASAATFLVVAADESVISEGGMFMIHNAWTIAAGNANDFLTQAELLDRLDQTLRSDYSNKSGNDIEQIKEWMDAETYFFGQEAVDAGFVDAIADAGSTANNAINWDLSAYKNPPQQNKMTKVEPEPEIEAPDLSAHYRQLEVINLTA